MRFLFYYNLVKVFIMRVQVINEVSTGVEGEWVLCFQWCLYVYDDGTSQNGFRYIWRRPDGSLQAARGQARLPSIPVAMQLMNDAISAGWGNNQDK